MERVGEDCRVILNARPGVCFVCCPRYCDAFNLIERRYKFNPIRISRTLVLPATIRLPGVVSLYCLCLCGSNSSLRFGEGPLRCIWDLQVFKREEPVSSHLAIKK